MMLGIRAVGLRYAPLTPRLIQRSGMHVNNILTLWLTSVTRSQPFAASKLKA